MFSFFFKKKQDWHNSLAFIGTDMHNHLLPGIDDGCPDPENGLKLYEGLMELGFKNFVFTPHILSDIHPNNRQTISAAFTRLSPLINTKNPNVKMEYAAEYMIDFDFEAIVSSGDLLSFGDEKNVLIEMSYLVESPNLKKMIFELQTRGFQPILAHPERYNFFHHRFSIYEELYDAGCSFQINLLSLIGHYGGGVKKTAEKLMHNNLVNWLGTDAHHMGHIELLRKLGQDKAILTTLNKIKNLKNTSLVL